MESLDIFLLDPVTGVQFQFPVNPSRIQFRGEASLETVEIAQVGEVDFAAGNKRTQMGWESFFPGTYNQAYCRYSNLPEPITAKNQIDAWRVAGTVLRLIISGVVRGNVRSELTNAPVLIASFTWELRGGEPDDIYYEIALRQYREVKIRTAVESGATNVQRMDLQPVPGRYVVKDNDTLYLIAQSQLGFGEKWPDIYELNKDTIGADPNLIAVGAALLMPGGGAPPTTVPPAVATEEAPRYTAEELAAALGVSESQA